MKQKERESLSKAVFALQNAAENIRRIEAEAQDALFSRDEREHHRQKLREKAMLLVELHERVEPYLDGMEAKIRDEIESGVNNFARRATQALGLSSTFYMSALLYPEDYKEGEMNDLERFIDGIKSKNLS